jgi:hypothetical protein
LNRSDSRAMVPRRCTIRDASNPALILPLAFGRGFNPRYTLELVGGGGVGAELYRIALRSPRHQRLSTLV